MFWQMAAGENEDGRTERRKRKKRGVAVEIVEKTSGLSVSGSPLRLPLRRTIDTWENARKDRKKEVIG